MRARGRRNVVVVTMAVLVCAAVALNWRFTQNQAAEGAAEETGDQDPGGGNAGLRRRGRVRRRPPPWMRTRSTPARTILPPPD